MLSLPVHAANPGPFTGTGNWTYVIPGVAPVLIDAGVGKPEHVAALADAMPDGPAVVIVTHAHSDHASGAPVLRERWPATVFRKIAWPERDNAAVPWQPLADGDVVPSAEGPLEVIHTPGHAPDHVVLWHAESRTIFGADLMQAGNTVFIPAAHGGDLAAYLRSLKRVRALSPLRVLPAHGPAIEDPVGLIDHYLSHRQQRETQVLTALEAGAATVETITARIYIGLIDTLAPLAQENVLAHLVKLEADGLVRRTGEGWRSIE